VGEHEAWSARIITTVPPTRAAVAAELGLDVIDLMPDFTSAPSPLALFPYEEGRHLVRSRGLHYGREGHRRVADRVIAFLIERQGCVPVLLERSTLKAC
jgi:hypothetical protein